MDEGDGEILDLPDPAADHADIEAEEGACGFGGLLKEFAGVDEEEGTGLKAVSEAESDDGLAASGGDDDHTGAGFAEGIDGFGLVGSEVGVEGEGGRGVFGREGAVGPLELDVMFFGDLGEDAPRATSEAEEVLVFAPSDAIAGGIVGEATLGFLLPEGVRKGQAFEERGAEAGKSLAVWQRDIAIDKDGQDKWLHGSP